ncbi:unnamed protein product [Didymodactylos carnosus]|uniref:Enoyl-CoA hydratase n=1 Tax=Didymodactylos carnosus TaxID=1234261 RepID=A0A814M0T4_9BILA|nr:unnamed protein product [Didymodactylos carnosus]CAF3839822.1 unnamed protein product [Didymodactylos carnosus]
MLCSFSSRLYRGIRYYSTYKNLIVKNVDDCKEILLIGLNRSTKRNAVNHETALELYEAFLNYENDSKSKIAIIHGHDSDSFCAGYDLTEVSIKFKMDYDKHAPAPMGPSRMFLSKPLIASIKGYAVAGGLELSLIADLRVSERSSKFGVYCRRFGVPLIDGGTVRLPRLIGLSRALDMIISGRTVNADEALSIGLINRLVEDGQSLSESIKLAKQLLKFPYQCMNTDRLSAYYSMNHTMDDSLKNEYENGIKIIEKESIQGAKRFVQGEGRGGMEIK